MTPTDEESLLPPQAPQRHASYGAVAPVADNLTTLSDSDEAVDKKKPRKAKGKKAAKKLDDEPKDDDEPAPIIKKTAEEEREDRVKRLLKGPKVGVFQLFRFTLPFERFLVVLAILVSIVHGVFQPLQTIVFSNMIDVFVNWTTCGVIYQIATNQNATCPIELPEGSGDGSSPIPFPPPPTDGPLPEIKTPDQCDKDFSAGISQYALFFCYIAAGKLLSQSFINPVLDRRAIRRSCRGPRYPHAVQESSAGKPLPMNQELNAWPDLRLLSTFFLPFLQHPLFSATSRTTS
jgi:hypothetical protein